MHHEILWRILRINRQRIRKLRGFLNPTGYVGGMHMIVLHLGRNPGANQDQIAAFYALDKGSVARDAGRLEKMGHIRREQDPENRRQYKMYLTEEGTKMQQSILAFYDDYDEQIKVGLTEEEKDVLKGLLARLDENSRSTK